MRYLVSLVCLAAVAGCSETNAPDDTVTEVEICRDCGDGHTVIPTYDNGSAPLPGTRPIADGDCETWTLSERDDPFTGADTLRLPWKYADTSISGVYVLLVPLSQKKVSIPCL